MAAPGCCSRCSTATATSPSPTAGGPTAVRDALDLCLACKGCKTDCPVNVDMATYKAEFLAHHYAGRLRPRSHYSMGWLPAVGRSSRGSRPATGQRGHARAGRSQARRVKAAGIDERRELPCFAAESFQRLVRLAGRPAATAQRGEVMLWPDTFTNHFHPVIAQGRRRGAGGGRLAGDGCPSGPLLRPDLDLHRAARDRQAGAPTHRCDVLAPHVRQGNPVVGLEPSCAAVFRSDAAELLPGDQTSPGSAIRPSRWPSCSTNTLPAGNLLAFDRRVARPDPLPSARHPRHADDRAILRASALDVDVLDSGCCGLAGNFGFETGPLRRVGGVRRACPAARDSRRRRDDCGRGRRLQLPNADRAGRLRGARAVHLAELLRGAVHGDDGGRPNGSGPGGRRGRRAPSGARRRLPWLRWSAAARSGPAWPGLR